MTGRGCCTNAWVGSDCLSGIARVAAGAFTPTKNNSWRTSPTVTPHPIDPRWYTSATREPLWGAAVSSGTMNSELMTFNGFRPRQPFSKRPSRRDLPQRLCSTRAELFFWRPILGLTSRTAPTSKRLCVLLFVWAHCRFFWPSSVLRRTYSRTS